MPTQFSKFEEITQYLFKKHLDKDYSPPDRLKNFKRFYHGGPHASLAVIVFDTLVEFAQNIPQCPLRDILSDAEMHLLMRLAVFCHDIGNVAEADSNQEHHAKIFQEEMLSMGFTADKVLRATNTIRNKDQAYSPEKDFLAIALQSADCIEYCRVLDEFSEFELAKCNFYLYLKQINSNQLSEFEHAIENYFTVTRCIHGDIALHNLIEDNNCYLTTKTIYVGLMLWLVLGLEIEKHTLRFPDYDTLLETGNNSPKLLDLFVRNKEILYAYYNEILQDVIKNQNQTFVYRKLVEKHYEKNFIYVRRLVRPQPISNEILAISQRIKVRPSTALTKNLAIATIKDTAAGIILNPDTVQAKNYYLRNIYSDNIEDKNFNLDNPFGIPSLTQQEFVQAFLEMKKLRNGKLSDCFDAALLKDNLPHNEILLKLNSANDIIGILTANNPSAAHVSLLIALVLAKQNRYLPFYTYTAQIGLQAVSLQQVLESAKLSLSPNTLEEKKQGLPATPEKYKVVRYWQPEYNPTENAYHFTVLDSDTKTLCPGAAYIKNDKNILQIANQEYADNYHYLEKIHATAVYYRVSRLTNYVKNLNLEKYQLKEITLDYQTDPLAKISVIFKTLENKKLDPEVYKIFNLTPSRFQENAATLTSMQQIQQFENKVFQLFEENLPVAHYNQLVLAQLIESFIQKKLTREDFTACFQKICPDFYAQNPQVIAKLTEDFFNLKSLEELTQNNRGIRYDWKAKDDQATFYPYQTYFLVVALEDLIRKNVPLEQIQLLKNYFNFSDNEFKNAEIVTKIFYAPQATDLANDLAAVDGIIIPNGLFSIAITHLIAHHQFALAKLLFQKKHQDNFFQHCTLENSNTALHIATEAKEVELVGWLLKYDTRQQMIEPIDIDLLNDKNVAPFATWQNAENNNLFAALLPGLQPHWVGEFSTKFSSIWSSEICNDYVSQLIRQHQIRYLTIDNVLLVLLKGYLNNSSQVLNPYRDTLEKLLKIVSVNSEFPLQKNATYLHLALQHPAVSIKIIKPLLTDKVVRLAYQNTDAAHTPLRLAARIYRNKQNDMPLLLLLNHKLVQQEDSYFHDLVYELKTQQQNLTPKLTAYLQKHSQPKPNDDFKLLNFYLSDYLDDKFNETDKDISAYSNDVKGQKEKSFDCAIKLVLKNEFSADNVALQNAVQRALNNSPDAKRYALLHACISKLYPVNAEQAAMLAKQLLQFPGQGKDRTECLEAYAKLKAISQKQEYKSDYYRSLILSITTIETLTGLHNVSLDKFKDKAKRRLSEAEMFFKMAVEETLFGFLPNAINDFNQAIKLNKDVTFRCSVWVDRAVAYQKLGNAQQAIADLDKVIAHRLDKRLLFKALLRKQELTQLSKAEFTQALLYSFNHEEFTARTCKLIISYLQLTGKAVDYLQQFIDTKDITQQFKLANLFSKLSATYPIFYVAEKNLLTKITECKDISNAEKLEAHQRLAKLFYYSAGSVTQAKQQFFSQCARNILAVKQLNQDQHTSTTEALTDILVKKYF